MLQFARYLIVKATWRCTYGANQSGLAASGLVMQRDRVWPFLSFLNMTNAMVTRAAQSGIRSPSFQVGVVVFTALLEIALRLTVLERDEFMHNSLRFGRRRRRTTVHSDIIDIGVRNTNILASQIEAEESVVRKPSAGQYALARRAFFSDLVVVEMVAEYVGIFVTPILIVVWRSRPLLGVFSYYNNSPDEVFNLGITLWPLMWSVGLQFIAEVIVDTVCILRERANGLTLLVSWYKKLRRRGNLFFTLFIWATVYSITSATGINRMQRQYDPYRCRDTDLCYCRAHNSQDLLSKYCELLYPPSGVPLNNSLYPPPPR
jgi:hypothetical protein